MRINGGTANVVAALAVGLIVGGGSAGAQSFSVTPQGGWSVDGSVGMMRSMGSEYVFNPVNGRTVSKLQWTTDNVTMFTGGVAFRPFSWLILGAKGATNITTGAHMADYDFNIPGCPPVPGGTYCVSDHPDTRLQSAVMLDFSAAGRVLEMSGFSLSVIGGFKRDYMKWQAYGGAANYAVLSPGLGISYEQWWSTPYIGLGIDGKLGAFGFSARMIGSTWGSGHDRDHHHLRSLVFTDDFDRTSFAQTDIGISYQLTSSTRLSLDYSYQRWMMGKGPTTIIQHGFFGGLGVIPGDAAGGGFNSQMLSLGLKVALGAERAAAPAGLKDAAPAPVRTSWSGVYVGLAAGWLSQQSDWTTTGLFNPPLQLGPIGAATAGANIDGRSGVVQAFLGYNLQIGNALVGAEGEFGRSNAKGLVSDIPGIIGPVGFGSSADATSVEASWEGSLRVRAGLLVTPSLLAYVTGGLAAQEVKAHVSCNAGGGFWCVADRAEGVSRRLTGWTAGAGLETMLSNGWFARAEYRYTDLGNFGSHSFFANAPVDTVHARIDNVTNQRVTVGLGYKF